VSGRGVGVAWCSGNGHTHLEQCPRSTTVEGDAIQLHAHLLVSISLSMSRGMEAYGESSCGAGEKACLHAYFYLIVG
jgi:hypothetical protein